MIVVRGSYLTDQICDQLDMKNGSEAPRHQSEGALWGESDEKVITRCVHSGRAVAVANNSEELTSVIHLLLTVSI